MLKDLINTIFDNIPWCIRLFIIILVVIIIKIIFFHFKINFPVEIFIFVYQFIDIIIMFLRFRKYKFKNKIIHGINVYSSGEEWNYIQPKFDEIKKLKGKKWFIHGDEEVFMDIKGNKINLKQGNYEYNGYSLNFDLTKKFKEPVIAINLQNKSSELFYVKLSDVKNLSDELTAMEYEAIADWFNENTGMEVISKGNKFRIKQLWILVDKGSKSDFLYSKRIVAGPFINMKQAKQQLEYFKKMEGITFYDKNKLIIEKISSYYDAPDYITVTLDELIKFANINGIKVNIRDILTDKMAVVALKNFGF